MNCIGRCRRLLVLLTGHSAELEGVGVGFGRCRQVIKELRAVNTLLKLRKLTRRERSTEQKSL
jgi:hypothetical protein